MASGACGVDGVFRQRREAYPQGLAERLRYSSKGSREVEREEDARASCGERNGIDAIYDVKACTRPCIKSTAVEKWRPIQ